MEKHVYSVSRVMVRMIERIKVASECSSDPSRFALVVAHHYLTGLIAPKSYLQITSLAQGMQVEKASEVLAVVAKNQADLEKSLENSTEKQWVIAHIVSFLVSQGMNKKIESYEAELDTVSSM